MDIEKTKAWLLIFIVGGGGILIGASILWVGGYIGLGHGQAEINLPIIVIAGVVVLVSVLGSLTYGFSLLGLADPKEALGLPSGSVRAVIALMLLVIFAIVAIFVYSNVSAGGRLQSSDNVTPQQLDSLKKNATVVLYQPENDKGPYKVYYRDATNTAGDDIAKQLIVLLGTLVTAVASFYFGSSSITAAQTAMEKARALTGGPVAERVEPPSLVIGKSNQPLKISGTHLEKVSSVKLTFGTSPPIVTTKVSGEDTELTCEVAVPKDRTEAGPWTVMVSDGSNNHSEIPNAITLKPAPN